MILIVCNTKEQMINAAATYFQKFHDNTSFTWGKLLIFSFGVPHFCIEGFWIETSGRRLGNFWSFITEN